MTFANLGLAVDSGSVVQATPALEKMTAATVQAEAAAQRLAGASKVEAAGVSAATAATRMHTAALQSQAMASRMVANDTRMLGYQINDIVVSLASGMNPGMVALQQGSQISQIGIKGLTNASVALLRSFGPAIAAVAALGVGFASLTTEINRNSKEQVSWTDVVVASWQLASESIISAFQPVIDTIGGWWDAASPYIAEGINKTIGLFNFGAQAIGVVWNTLPGVIGEAVWNVAQNTVNGVVWMVREVQATINGLIVKVNDTLKTSIGQLQLMPYLDLGSNPLGGGVGDLASGLAGAWDSAMGTNYLDMIGDRARKLAAAHGESAKGADKSNDAHKRLAREGLTDAQKEAQRLADTLENALGSALSSLFDGPLSSVDDALKGILGSFAQLGQQNLQNTFDGLFSKPANDNGQSWQDARERIFGAVRDGSKEGTSGGLTDFLKNNAGNASAGLGGLGIGYQTQSPLMGAVGGAVSGFGATGNPLGAVIGGIAGFVGGLLGMNDALVKAQKAVNDNRASIDQFIATGMGKKVDEISVAVAQFKAQGAQLVEVAKAAGDTRLVNQLERAMNAYRGTLKTAAVRDDFDQAKSDLLDAYKAQADGLQTVIDRTRDFIDTTKQFQDSLKLDKQYSPLNPEGLLAESQKQFDLLISKAKLGDTNAQGRVQGAASSYLDAARGYLGSSQGYQDIFDKVQSALGGVVGSATSQLSNAERQLRASDRQIELLGGVKDAVLTIPQAVKNMEKVLAAAAKLQGKDADKLVNAIEKLGRKLDIADLKKPAKKAA